MTRCYVISDDTEMESDAQNEAVDDEGSRTSGHAPTRSGWNRWSAWSCRSPGWDHAKTKLCGHALRSQKKRLRKGQTSVQVEICLEAKSWGKVQPYNYPRFSYLVVHKSSEFNETLSLTKIILELNKQNYWVPETPSFKVNSKNLFLNSTEANVIRCISILSSTCFKVCQHQQGHSPDLTAISKIGGFKPMLDFPLNV